MLTRRASLLLPLMLGACGGDEAATSFPPLRYDYLAPLRLNVAAIQVEQRFVPSGVAPDVTQFAPVPAAGARQRRPGRVHHPERLAREPA